MSIMSRTRPGHTNHDDRDIVVRLRNGAARMLLDLVQERDEAADTIESIRDYLAASKHARDVAVAALSEQIDALRADCRLMANAMKAIDEELDAADGVLVMVAMNKVCSDAAAVRAAIARHAEGGG